jgi:hypothetical protein
VLLSDSLVSDESSELLDSSEVSLLQDTISFTFFNFDFNLVALVLDLDLAFFLVFSFWELSAALSLLAVVLRVAMVPQYEVVCEEQVSCLKSGVLIGRASAPRFIQCRELNHSDREFKENTFCE